MAGPAPPAIPILDLRGGADADEAALAAQLGAACRNTGFFLLAEWGGVDPAIVDAMMDQCRALFALPLADKMALLADENNRGYTPLAEETLDPGSQSRGDTKEGYYIGREVPLDSPEADLPLHGPNVWPPAAKLPGFRPAAEAYMASLTALGRRLVALLALSLGLPRGHFDGAFDRPMVFLRPLRYSGEASRPEDGVFGAGAHSDYGMLTILATDGRPGLQVYLDGAWADVAPPPRAFVCNLGDMLERWTNGVYRSTLHRVVLPPAGGGGGASSNGDHGDQGGGGSGGGATGGGAPRHSLPFFFEPNFDARVECLPCCVSAERPAGYAPTTAGRHLLDKYAATHAGYSGGSGGGAKSKAGGGGGGEGGKKQEQKEVGGSGGGGGGGGG